MKRYFCVFLVLIILCNSIGCGSQSDLSPDSPNEETVVTVNDVVSYFDQDAYQIQIYDSEMISQIQEKLSLNSEIISIVHATKLNNEESDLEWAYIYELSDVADAIWLEENRTAFVSTIDNGTCIRSNRIIVFGNSSVILSLKTFS